MTANQPIPAAQYVRMSTEHQQYSLENQMTAIQNYAKSHDFDVVRTYSDSAKSGLVLKHRSGLRQLLQDVVSGSSGCHAILVYDVSRWGRFQDTDESAHYEFLCRSAGVPVHYCAEQFANDGSLPSLIMKALKRTMAGEYSRELGVKVLAGQRRMAQLGFKLGGHPGYGLRRLLVAPDRSPKQILANGERKSLATDRVVFVPGPIHEIEIVRQIYRMFVSDKMSIAAIAGDLNRKKIMNAEGRKWRYASVYAILTHPKYSGCHVFGRTSARLYTPMVKVPKSDWIVTPGAIEPLVDANMFEAAKKIQEERTVNRSDEDLLNDLRRLLSIHGRLSMRMIGKSLGTASQSTYRKRFGSIRAAYERVGYGRPEDFGSIDLNRRTKGLRDELISKILELFPSEMSVRRPTGRWRTRLRLKKGLLVSVLIARTLRTRKGTLRWQAVPAPSECESVTLLARLDEANRSFLDFHVLSGINRKKRFRISKEDPRLGCGVRLHELSQLIRVVNQVREAQRASRKGCHDQTRSLHIGEVQA
jgi:DNA invertase Pin-like site-specific DNA recombinase